MDTVASQAGSVRALGDDRGLGIRVVPEPLHGHAALLSGRYGPGEARIPENPLEAKFREGFFHALGLIRRKPGGARRGPRLPCPRGLQGVVAGIREIGKTLPIVALGALFEDQAARLTRRCPRPAGAFTLRAAHSCSKRHERTMTVRAPVEMITNQRHHRPRLQPGELRLDKTIQPLETLVTADLGLAGLGYDPRQFDDITTLEHRKPPSSFLTARAAIPTRFYPSSNTASTSFGATPATSIRLFSFLRASCSSL